MTAAAVISGGPGDDWRGFLSAVPVGRCSLDGRPWTLPLYDTQGVLLVGRSGAGKSSVTWSLNISLAPAIIAGVVELVGLDPKGMELDAGREFFAHYADEPEPMVALLERTVERMRARKNQLRAAGLRKFMPSVETPLVIIEVDELAYITSLLGDNKMQKRGRTALQTLLTQGRATGFLVLGCIQDPRKETLDDRDLYQVVVALKMPRPMALLVLGRDAVEAGADTNLIPAAPDGAGVAFVLDANYPDEPMQVRAGWASDQSIREWAEFVAESRRRLWGGEAGEVLPMPA